MLYINRIAAMLAIGSVLASAQTSVGISTNDPKPLKNYRLPAWGYSNGKFLINASGSMLDRKNDANDDYSANQSLLLAPSYNYFLESEDHTMTAEGFLNKSFMQSKTRTNNDLSNYNYKRTSNYHTWLLNLRGESRRYYGSTYGMAAPEINYYYNRNKTTITQEYVSPPFIDKEKTSILFRYYDIKAAAAFGFGRVRNVTPVIKALRLNERLKALSKNIEFDQSEIERAAIEFTRYPGYQAIYDRPEKFFWNSFSEKLNELTPFEMHYLNDIFSEVNGTRYEGAEADAGVRFTRLDILQEATLGEDKIKGNFIGPAVRTRLYHNYSLKGQIGINGIANWDFLVGNKKDNPVGDVKQFEIKAEHLYVISDRVLFTVTPSYSYVDVKINDEYLVGIDNYTSSYFKLNCFLTYYIEDHISLDGSFSWTHLKNKPQSPLTGYFYLNGTNYFGQLFFYGYEKTEQMQFQLTLNYYFGKKFW
ncbi:hypothetical protein HUU42_04755 [bacterium]|nr:hypothetical protein [bacterium]